MRVRQIVLSWRPMVSFGLLAAVVILFSGAATGSHLLTMREKEAIRAADGTSEQQVCYYINSYYCQALNGTGSGSTVTACGGQSYPNCSGDCTNSCSQFTTTSYACQSVTNAGYKSCPTFEKNNDEGCGVQTTGATCTGNTSPTYCYCTNGTSGQTSCGAQTNQKPNPFPPACPNNP